MTTKSLAAAIANLGLDDRAWFVLGQRFGPDRDSTLDEVGQKLSVSRERVRQIQKTAINRILQRINRTNCLFELFEFKADELWSLTDEITSIDANGTMAHVLTRNGWSEIDTSLIDKAMIAIRALAKSGNGHHLAQYERCSAVICVLPPVIDDLEPVAKEVKRRKEDARQWTYREIALRVLEDAGKPLHWKDMARLAEALGHRKEFSRTTFYNVLLGPEFVLVDTGTYGPRAWGLQKAQNLIDVIADVLHENGAPMTFSAVLHQVLQRRSGSEASARMFVDMHARFYRSVNGLYGLRAWLSPRETQTLRTPSQFVEDGGSYLRVERSIQQGYNVQRIINVDLDRRVSEMESHVLALQKKLLEGSKE